MVFTYGQILGLLTDERNKYISNFLVFTFFIQYSLRHDLTALNVNDRIMCPNWSRIKPFEI